MKNTTLALVGWMLVATSVGAMDRYVVKDNPGAMPPYTNWTTAAANIQDAIDAAVAGDTVWVSNGVYQTGGAVAPFNNITNRVMINKSLIVKSVNGAEATIIRGAPDPLLTNGPAAVRGVWIASNSVLEGFTVEMGHTESTNSFVMDDQQGGGILSIGWGEGTVIGCRIVNNVAARNGGGVYQGTIKNCMVVSNRAHFGGGTANVSGYNLLIAYNSAEHSGGGDDFSRLRNCTVFGNVAPEGGGCMDSDVTFSIVVGNTGGNYGGEFPELEYSCSDPMPPGEGNMDEDPLFSSAATGDFTLSSASPCIDAGIPHAFIGTDEDLAGRPRLINGVVDMGAYEFPFDGKFILRSTTDLAVPEGGAAAFMVMLAQSIVDPVTVLVSRVSGDADITVVGPTQFIFNSATWSTGQTITLSAPEDADFLYGQAVFHATSPGWTTSVITAYELDNDTDTPDAIGEAVDATDLVWTTFGDSPWYYQEATTRDGVDAARSGILFDNQESLMETTVSGPALVSFWRKFSNSSYFEAVFFLDIDGTNHFFQFTWQFTDWQFISLEIEPGIHNLTWGVYMIFNPNFSDNSAFVDELSVIPLDETDTDGDGLPNAWENQHYGGPTNANPNEMAANGLDTVGEAYIADLNPTNPASVFPNIILTNPPPGAMSLVVDPSSTGRVYGVRWTTNLLAVPQMWTLMPPEKAGTGAAVTFTITNDAPSRSYRTGVRLP